MASPKLNRNHLWKSRFKFSTKC